MNFPATFLQRLESKRLIPFVGSGVSTAVKSRSNGEPLFPSWRLLLERAADRLDDEQKSPYAQVVRNLLKIDKPDFLDAAKRAKEGLGAVWFNFLKEQFDHKRDEADDATVELARAIWSLGSNLIVTTNYDRVLQWACPKQDDVSFWNIDAPAEQAAAIRDGLDRPVIWHLHGSIDDASNIILTPEGYERLYPTQMAENRFTAALPTLRSLLTSHSFLFIGFSLSDEAFGLQLKAASEIFGGATGPHYALVHTASAEGVRAQKLPGIEVLEFPEIGLPLVNLVKGISQIKSAVAFVGDCKPIEVDAESRVGRQIIVEEGFDDVCDTPPPTTHWVGREEELQLLRNMDSKVVAVTGIGGQGKSTLVAKYLSEVGKEGGFWDWRDCKEESNTLHTQIVRIIERLTNGQRRASDLAQESNESVVKLFLSLTLSMKGIFVFDNIDQYIDVYRARAVETMNYLIEGATRSAGTSKFIFTARPKVAYDQPNFLQLELHGLRIEEARQLFGNRGLMVDPKHINEIHELTQGHPLWINLIAMQVLTNRVRLADLITRIRAGKDAGLPNVMLQEIWSSLKPKHQKMLRYLAEMVRPETENELAQCIGSELNFNQFTKSLRQLKTLDLVVVKSPLNAPDTLELHPLLREFVRRQFSRSERSPYISAIIVFFDRLIVRFRPNLGSDLSFEVLQNWTAKVELLINSGELQQALGALDEIRSPLLRSGYAEEFVRLAMALFSNLELSETAETDKNVNIRDNIYIDLVEVLSQLGRFSEAEDFAKRFEAGVAGATARYVALCNMRTYLYWTKGDLDLAKEWGRRGVEVKSLGNLDTRHDCSHNLALAQRDSGDVDAALDYFLRGSSLEEVANPHAIDQERGGSFYGNIGRCLFFKSDVIRSESCLIKSAWLLEQAKDHLFLLNSGWVAQWLGELNQQRSPEMAYIFYRRAASKWKLVSPQRAEHAAMMMHRLVDKVPNSYTSLEDWQVDRKYSDWLNEMSKFSKT